MTETSLPIVGAFYRPPAKALINALAVGTRLILRAEPDNAYDPNAVMVILNSADIGEAGLAALDGELANFGFTVQNVLDQEEWHIGYVAKEIAARLKGQGVVNDGTDVEGRFRLSVSGVPRVVIEE